MSCPVSRDGSVTAYNVFCDNICRWLDDLPLVWDPGPLLLTSNILLTSITAWISNYMRYKDIYVSMFYNFRCIKWLKFRRIDMSIYYLDWQLHMRVCVYRYMNIHVCARARVFYEDMVMMMMMMMMIWVSNYIPQDTVGFNYLFMP